MTTGVLLPDAERFIHTTLAGDATLGALIGGTGASARLFLHPAPEGQPYPLVTYQNQSSPTRQAVGAIRVMDAPLYLVRGIVDQVDNRQGTLRAIASRIMDVLHRSSGTAGTGPTATVLSCILESEFALTEIVSGEGGRRYEHLGALFRVRLQN